MLSNKRTGVAMSLDEAVKLSETIENDFVKKWKDGGGRVVAHACDGMPVELVDAAGFFPYRLRALSNPDTESADAHLSRFNCRFCRSCLQLVIEGEYDFLDGVIESNGCDHIRAMFENWEYVLKPSFFHYIRIPHITTDDALDYFEGQIRLLKEALERHFEVEVTESDLWLSINRYKALYSRIRKLCELRERENPAFTGAEAMSLTLLATAMPVESYNDLIDRVLIENEGRNVPVGRARIMLCGGATDELDFIKELESTGAQVVADSLCFGSRAFARQETDCEDPIRALAEMYLRGLLCPRMFKHYPERRDYVFSAIDRAKVDGVILVKNKFCDLHGVDNVQLRMDLERRGIPALHLEKDYGAASDIGRIKTRVQAFLERLGGLN